MIGELRKMLSHDRIGPDGKAPKVYLYASEKEYLYRTYYAMLGEGDVCIVLHRDNSLLQVLTSAGTGFIETLDTQTIYGEYGKFYTHQRK